MPVKGLMLKNIFATPRFDALGKWAFEKTLIRNDSFFADMSKKKSRTEQNCSVNEQLTESGCKLKKPCIHSFLRKMPDGDQSNSATAKLMLDL